MRDEILNIMHRNKIPEKKGTWMEEWHQKLHNVRRPALRPCCVALPAGFAGPACALTLDLTAATPSLHHHHHLQNTTPDDVPICEAYLAFLRSNGDQGAYWSVLSSEAPAPAAEPPWQGQE